MKEVATELERLRKAIEQESTHMDAGALVPLLKGPMIIEQSSHLCVDGEEGSTQYSVGTSMFSSMEMPR
jgi:hypothetical protein